jgi:hypothetical protein
LDRVTGNIERSGGSDPRIRWPIVGLVAVVLAAVVLIEGFALSWGARSTPAKVSPPITIKAIRLCPTTTAHLMAVDYLRYPEGDQRARVSGHVVTVHCGGFDDFQFIVHTASVTVSLRKGARIVLMTSSPSYYVGNLRELNDYLSTDFDGNVFVVTGPATNATGLIAEFHP